MVRHKKLASRFVGNLQSITIGENVNAATQKPMDISRLWALL
jgi:hypothetical protein